MPEMLDTSCPHCGHTQKVNFKFVGKTWPCPSCGEDYNVVAPTTNELRNDEPFQTFTPDEFAELRPLSSLLDEEEPVAKQAECDNTPTDAAIAHSFLDFEWYRLAEPDTFRALTP